MLKLKNQKPKYQITHPTGKIGETDDVQLKVHYNSQPWVGPLTWDMDWQLLRWEVMGGGSSEAFKLPTVKKTDASKKKSK